MDSGGRSSGLHDDRSGLMGRSEPLETDVCSVCTPVSGWRLPERRSRTRLVDSSDSLCDRDTACGLLTLASSHSPPAKYPHASHSCASGPT